MAQLDQYLAHECVMHRELMGFESNKFLKLFPSITVLEGGAESLFNPLRPHKYEPRLLQVRISQVRPGKKIPVTREVPMLAAELNEGNTFIYDGGLDLVVWHGRDVTSQDKTKANAVANAIHDSRSAASAREVVEQGLDDERPFWARLGGEREVAPAVRANAAPSPHGPKRLMKLSDSSGKMVMSEVATEGAISRTQLRSEDVFILDDGFEVLVWVGVVSGSQRSGPRGNATCSLFGNRSGVAVMGHRAGKTGREWSRTHAMGWLCVPTGYKPRRAGQRHQLCLQVPC